MQDLGDLTPCRPSLLASCSLCLSLLFSSTPFRSLVAAAVLACAAVTLLALLASNAASRRTMLMDYNYPAQYVMIQKVRAPPSFLFPFLYPRAAPLPPSLA